MKTSNALTPTYISTVLKLTLISFMRFDKIFYFIIFFPNHQKKKIKSKTTQNSKIYILF